MHSAWSIAVMVCSAIKNDEIPRDDLPHHWAASTPLLDAEPARLKACRLLVRQRHAIGRNLGFDLCPDPVWDMLLDLYGAEREGRHVTLTNLCAASNVPFTTARRALDEIVSRKFAVRERDLDDGRRIFIGLTEAGRRALAQILDDFLQGIAA